MPNGKQTLLSLLTKYSQHQTTCDEIDLVTQNVKAGLLLHGSTSKAMWKMVDELGWLERFNETEGRTKQLERQGLGLKESGFLISELFEMIMETPNIPEHIEADYPELKPEAYRAGLHMIWLLLRALEWSAEIKSFNENDALGEDEKEKLLSSYLKKLDEYSLDPEDYS